MKAHFYKKAIEAFRRVGKCSERVDELHRRLLEIQERAMATMTHEIGPSIKLTETARAVVADLDGRTLEDALMRLATAVWLPSRDEMHEQVVGHMQSAPLGFLFGHQVVNAEGRVTSTVPGADLRNTPATEAAITASMYEHLENVRGAVVVGIIQPARDKIWCDHPVTEADFYGLVNHNPIVPEGREPLFARALYAGLSGDFIQAANVAIPQLEHAIRCLLKRCGVITTRLDENELQDEKPLGTLLDEPELTEMLGPDRVFDLRSLLTERNGANLRNLVAHGMLHADAFFSAPAIYVWWLTLHLCFLPILVGMSEATGSPIEANDSEHE